MQRGAVVSVPTFWMQRLRKTEKKERSGVKRDPDPGENGVNCLPRL